MKLSSLRARDFIVVFIYYVYHSKCFYCLCLYFYQCSNLCGTFSNLIGENVISYQIYLLVNAM